jgi:hypothetical protein
VHPAAPLAPAGHGEIDVGERGGAALELALTLCERVLKLSFEGIRCSADFPSFLRVERGETFENFGEGTTLAAQELGLELLEPARVRLRDLLQALPQRF